jgi:hypothetical protein
MKKHNCLLPILIIAWCGAARAQEQAQPSAPTQVKPARQPRPHHAAPPQHRWSFYASGGAAFPIGQFAHTDKDDPQSGPVHTGSLLELGGTAGSRP